jgi:predicted HicB family RNase H-like nuclease
VVFGTGTYTRERKREDDMAGKKKGKDKGKIKAKVEGNGILPVPKDGPNLTLRARNQSQIDRIKRAAGKAELSMNTWAIEVLDRAAQAAGVSR